VIPFANPHLGYLEHRAEIDAAIAGVLARGEYILGAEVRAFEAEFAAWHGVPFCCGVANGTDAVMLALRACGVGAGDEVITPSQTAVATVAAIELAGALPVFVDIDPQTLTICPDAARRAVGKKTRAIVAVHLYGQPAELGELQAICREHELKLIEDCAQAHGATYRHQKVGTLGDAAAFSFYPTKNLGALGDGGAVITRDAAIYGSLQLLRQYGWRQRYISDVPGHNSRLDELQAAILRVKLRHLDADNQRRIAIADYFGTHLPQDGIELPHEIAGTQSVFHLYVVRSKQREILRQALTAAGVGTAIHYPMPVHAQPAYVGRCRVAGSLANTEAASRQVLSLPMYPQLSLAAQEQICAALQRAVGAPVSV
jgi:dTDP-4-amino-4,6-dideoxygalactose transaminase